MMAKQWIGAALAVTFVIAAAQAEQNSVRVIGTIASVDGSIFLVKQKKGGDARLRLTEKAQVYGVALATLADVKPGSFIGVGAMPQADGSQKAIRVMIFAEEQRGLGEGHRPWSRPGTTMTNATVDTTVAGVDGQILHVKYKGGEQRITIGKDAIIRAYVVGGRDELKPGAHIAINAAKALPDGTVEASRVNVGRGDVVPD
jgi:hypothetical protein